MLEIQSKVIVIFNGNKWENPIYVVRQGTNKNEWSPYGCSIKICYIKTSIGCSILISDMFDISLMLSLGCFSYLGTDPDFLKGGSTLELQLQFGCKV